MSAKLVTLEGDMNLYSGDDLGFSTARAQAFLRKKTGLQKLQNFARKKGAPRFKNRFFSLLGENENLYSGEDLMSTELLGKGVNWAKLRAGLRKGIGFAANVFVPGSGALIEKTMAAADKAGIGPKLKIKFAKRNIAKVISEKMAKLSPRQKTAVAAAKTVYDSAIRSGKQVFEAIRESKSEMNTVLQQIPEKKEIDYNKIAPYALGALGVGAFFLISKGKK